MKLFYLLLIIALASYAVMAEVEQVCTADYTPVCGTDGVTYGNKCLLDYRNSVLEAGGKPLIQVVCQMACNECDL